jgi:hypothetical protein
MRSSQTCVRLLLQNRTRRWNSHQEHFQAERADKSGKMTRHGHAAEVTRRQCCRLEDWIDEGNPVRAIDAFVEKLDLSGLGFDGVAPEATGRPSYHPSGLLKLYIYAGRAARRYRRERAKVRTRKSIVSVARY